MEILHAEDSARSSNPRSNGAVSVQGSVIDLTLDESVEDLAQLAADITQPQAPPSIDNAIDQLTTDLAAFCFDHLERSLISSEDEVASTNNLEVELQVRLMS